MPRVCIGLLRFARVWCRLEVTGLEHMPRSGPVIVASNHMSFIDSVVIPTVAPRRVRFLAKEEYFTGTGVKGRASALFFRYIGAVPVPRDGSRDALAALSLAQQVLEGGEAFGIYPEGTRSRDGRLYRGRTGVGHLALTAGVPVVPVGLTEFSKHQLVREPTVEECRAAIGLIEARFRRSPAAQCAHTRRVRSGAVVTDGGRPPPRAGPATPP